MELTNEFTVTAPPERAWAVLTDLQLVAPCLPGARLEGSDGESFRGSVKVKVGPVTAEYRGTARFVEQDAGGHRAVLRAEGRDSRGQGNANATVTATLHETAGGTAVRVVTELSVTGRVAQFSRGVLGEVSAKLLSQFAACLETTVLQPAAPAEPAQAGSEPATPTQPWPPEAAASGADAGEPDAPEPGGGGVVAVDVLDLAAGSLAKRLVAAVLVAGAAVAIAVLLRQRGR